MADLTGIESSQSVKLVGSDINGGETTPLASTSNQELKSFDVADNGGLDSVITIAAAAVVELKVGGSVKAVRKYVQIQAKGKDVTWGFTVGTQSFDAFKSQFFILPIGSGTSVYIKNNGASPVDVAIAEIS